MNWLSGRRTFIKQLSCMGVAATGIARFSALDRSLDAQSLSSAKTSNLPIKNRQPLASSAFYPLPLGSIRPTGWLRQQLQIQAKSLGGHLDETWADVGPNSDGLGVPESHGSEDLIFWMVWYR